MKGEDRYWYILVGFVLGVLLTLACVVLVQQGIVVK